MMMGFQEDQNGMDQTPANEARGDPLSACIKSVLGSPAIYSQGDLSPILGCLVDSVQHSL